MRIRSATPSDLPQLAQWMERLIAHVQASSGDPYLLNLDADYQKDFRPWFVEKLKSQFAAVYIAEDSDGIRVGFIAGSVASPFFKSSSIKQIGLIEVCWVEPLFRNKGVARRLCEEIESWFKRRGIRYIELQYLVGNQVAEDSWTRLGYMPYRVGMRKTI